MGFVRVFFSDDGCTVLRPAAGALVSDILELTLRKRGVRVGADYVLELKTEPGRALDMAAPLSSFHRADGRATELKVASSTSISHSLAEHFLLT